MRTDIVNKALETKILENDYNKNQLAKLVYGYEQQIKDLKMEKAALVLELEMEKL